MNNLFLSQQQLRIGPKLPSFMTSKQRKIDAAGFFFFFKQKSFNKKKKSFICFPNHLKKYVNLIFRYSNIIDLFYRH